MAAEDARPHQDVVGASPLVLLKAHRVLHERELWSPAVLCIPSVSYRSSGRRHERNVRHCFNGHLNG